MEAFRAVMVSGTTKEAAALMNVSQPAVSRLIQDLEGLTGVALFDRVQGRLQPKPEAHALLQEAEEALLHLDRLDNSIRNVRRLRGAPLRIAASPAFVYGVMPQVLAMFRKQYPDTPVSLRITARREVRDWVDAQDFDLAVAMLPIDYPATKCEFLVRVRGVCVVPAGHPLGQKDVIHASDTEGHPFVSLLPETMARARLDKIFQSRNIKRELALDTQTASALCLAVEAGLGIGVVDPFTAERFASAGILIRPFKPAVEYEYTMLYPINRRRSEIVAQFAELVHRGIRAFDKHIIS